MMTYALVTGATSGIGECMAYELARVGCGLILTGRQEDKLQVLQRRIQKQYQVPVYIYKLDLGDEEARTQFIKALKKLRIRLKYVVNNAGVGHYGLFEAGSWQADQETIRINIEALTYLTRALAPFLRRGSKVLQVASTAAFAPGPYMAVYYASKAYVLSFALALRKEWQPKGISVSVLCPGPTKTAFQSRAHMEKKGLAKSLAMSPQAVARIGFKGMCRNKAIIIPGISNKIAARAMELLPTTVGVALVNSTQDKGASES